MTHRRKLLKPAASEALDEDPLSAVSGERQFEPDASLGQQQQNRQIIAMLASLPLEQRLIVELKIFQSLTFEEIAAMQEISENTAKTRFYAALKKLRLISEAHHVLP